MTICTNSFEEKYFNIYGHCRWIKGPHFGAIYDLFREQVFCVKQPDVANGLDYALNGKCLSEASNLAGLDENILKNFCHTVVALGYGKFSCKLEIVEEFLPFITKEKIQKLEFNQPIYRALFQITDKCLYKCDFCGFNEGISTSLCSCGCWEVNRPFASEALLQTLDHLINLECNRLDIQGGEPFLEPGRLWPIVKKARSAGIPVFIHTTAFRLGDSTLIDVLNQEVNLVIPVFGSSPQIFDSITGCPGSFDSLVRVLEFFKNNFKSNITAKVILLPHTSKDFPEIKEWLSDMGVRQITVEYYKPFMKKSPDEKNIFSEIFISSDAKFKPNIFEFQRLKDGHACFEGTLAVTLDGRLVPCVAAVNDTIADLNTISLVDALHKELMEPYWHQGTESRTSCKQCEFRYVCISCTLQTERLLSKNAARSWNCLYDPSTGKWGV